jgi:hypothetical protein
MVQGLLILFWVFVLWPLGRWLQDRLLGGGPKRLTGPGKCLADDEIDFLARLDILSDGHLDGRFGDHV